MKADQSQQFVRTIEIKDRTGRVIGSKEVITYQGLLSKAHDEGLKRIHTSLVQTPSDENARTAIAKAEVETEKGCFQALGDASPESVTPFLIPHLIRMAETRAKARALRDAVNVGVISFEELDGEDLDGRDTSDLGSGAPAPPRRNGGNGSPARPRGNGQASSPRATNGSPESMSEAQRRYLFRLMAGQGFHKEAAEEHLKDLLEVDSLTAVTKLQATDLIDELLKGTAPRSGERSGAANP
jgi:hypothetical protein